MTLHFSVQDTGIGISAADQQRIFAPFTQADATTTRKFGGSGLGLAISKSLIELMGGTLQVKSRPDSGSEFFFTVRLGLAPVDRSLRDRQVTTRTAAATSPGEVVPEGLRDVPVLLVVENLAARHVLQRILARWSMKTEIAADVPAALTKFYAAVAAKSPFPLVIADAHLPKTDGYSLAGWIRNDPKLAGAIILMVSPLDRHTSPSRCRETEAVCLEKPLCRSDLLAALKKALGSRKSQASAPAAPAAIFPERPPPRPLRVLLAEDTPANQTLCRHLLQRRGHAVESAGNGETALRLVAERDFDVVLMDVQMPVMDGFEATAHIRALADAKKAGVPIVALTAYAMRGDLERCLQSGMSSYLSKPFQPKELIDAVEQAADHAPAGQGGVGRPAPSAAPERIAGVARPEHSAGVARPERSDGRGEGPDEQSTPPANPRGAPPDVEMEGEPSDPAAPLAVFNLAEGIARTLGRYDLFCQMVEFFYQETDPLVQRIREGVHDADAEEVAYAAHRLKGTILYLGSRPATAIVERMERMGRSGNLAGARQSLAELERWVTLLKDALLPHRAAADRL